MAGTKISALTAAAAAQQTHEFPVNEAGTTKKVTLAQMLVNLVQSGWAATFAGTIVQTDLTIGSSSTANNGRIVISQDNPPTVGSGGAGISALSVVAGSTNTAGRVNATLTAVAPGVVIGVVAFDDGPLATAPIAVMICLSGPTAGDAAPPDIGADTYTTSGFTIRSYGPTTVTTAAYVITYFCVFA